MVALVIGAFVEVVGAEESMQTLRRMQHVIARAAGSLIVLIVFPRWIELCEIAIELVVRDRRARLRYAVRCIEGKRGRAFKW